MREWGRHAAGWLAAIGVVGVLAVALTLRGGSIPAGQAPETTSPSADAIVAAATATPTPRPTPEPTAEPTATPQPATPTPMPATPVPTPVAVAPAPAATPVPVHDDDPVLPTEDRVTGAFGASLAIGDYRVRAVRKTSPSTHECASRPATVAFEVTVWHGGPVESVYFGIADAAVSACFETDSVDSPWFPHAVTRDVFVTSSDGLDLSGSPLTVWVSPDGGAHTLTFEFR